MKNLIRSNPKGSIWTMGKNVVNRRKKKKQKKKGTGGIRRLTHGLSRESHIKL
jgi:hypothetical protein